MQHAAFISIEQQIQLLGEHASHALLALDHLRHSPDPAERLAYREVHDLLGDLGALRMTVELMPR